MIRLLLVTLAAALAAAPSAHAGFSGSATSPASTATAAPVFKPRLVTAPTISGTPRERETLTADDGTWARRPTKVERQWLRCDSHGEACEEIAGATATTYVPAAADLQRRLRLRVTATNAAGAVVATSASAGPIDRAFALNPPTFTRAPSVTGTAAVDERLEATPGEWEGAERLGFQWVRCSTGCADIPGETERTYDVVGADAGKSLRVRVTATNTAGERQATSHPTAPIARRTYTQILCANPATGRGVIPDGQLPEGMTYAIDSWPYDSIAARSRCGGTMGLTGGIPLMPAYRVAGTGWSQKGAVIRYRAPAGTIYQGATIYRRLSMPGSLNMIAGFNGSDGDWIYGGPIWELCEMVKGCRGVAEHATSPWQHPLGLGSSASNGFQFFTRCGAPDNSWTCTAAVDDGYRFYGGRVALQDPADPWVTSPPDGTLAKDQVLPAQASLRLAAADDQSGLYRVRVRVGGQVVAQHVVDANGGRCADADPANADAYEFAHGAPCVKRAAVSLTFDTSGWPRGEHRVQVVLEDAGRNTVSVVDRVARLGG